MSKYSTNPSLIPPKDSEEEDLVEKSIRATGCWEEHIAILDCKADTGDWRQCRSQKVHAKESPRGHVIIQKELTYAPRFKLPGTISDIIMLSDIFGEFVIDDDEVKDCVQFCTPEQYSAEIHDKGWFLAQSSTKNRTDDEKRELVYHKAAYHHYHEEFEDAVKEYKSLYNDFKHSRSHSVAVIDSLICSALKVPSYPQEELLRYLHEYEQSALDYGDQLQYLNAAKEVYGRIEGEEADRKFIDAVCLLCATVDLPEHWLAFGIKKGLEVGPNFHLGYHVRALILLERHSSQARGFVVNAVQIRLNRVKEKLTALGYSPEQVREARLEMGLDLFSNDERSDLSEELQRPAHDCRSKIGVYKTPEECTRILLEFRRKFSWMFNDV